MTDIREYLAHKPLLFDGGMGTYYKAAPGADCEMANLTDPEGVKKVHAEYLAAGAQAIKTNTFGLPRMAAAQMPGWEELAEAGWKLACDAAAEKDAAVFADLGNEGSINCVADVGGDTCAGGINEAVGAGRKCAAVSIEGDGTVGADRMLVVYLNIDGMSIHTDRIISKAAIGIDGDVDECKLTILGLDSLLNEEEVAPAACGIKHGKVKLREPLVAAELLTGGHFILIPHGVSVVSVDEVLSNIAFSDYILNH